MCHEEHWAREVHVWKGEVLEPSELCRPRVVVDAVKDEPAVVDRVVDRVEPTAVVVDAMTPVVVDRNKDRHAMTDGRKEYLRKKQREFRARRSSFNTGEFADRHFETNGGSFARAKTGQKTGGSSPANHPAKTCPQCEEKDAEIARLREQVKALVEDLVALVGAAAELDKVRGHEQV